MDPPPEIYARLTRSSNTIGWFVRVRGLLPEPASMRRSRALSSQKPTISSPRGTAGATEAGEAPGPRRKDVVGGAVPILDGRGALHSPLGPARCVLDTPTVRRGCGAPTQWGGERWDIHVALRTDVDSPSGPVGARLSTRVAATAPDRRLTNRAFAHRYRSTTPGAVGTSDAAQQQEAVH